MHNTKLQIVKLVYNDARLLGVYVDDKLVSYGPNVDTGKILSTLGHHGVEVLVQDYSESELPQDYVGLKPYIQNERQF